MMKNTGYILALCLAASGQTLAHDVWITGKQAENNVTAEIGYGHNFPSKGTIPDRRDFFETPRLYNGKETITLKPTSTDYVYKTDSAGNGNSYGSVNENETGILVENLIRMEACQPGGQK